MAVAVVRDVSGPAALGRRTKLLVKTLRPGTIAVLDHRDLDRVSAEDLIAAGVDHQSDLRALRPYIRDVKPVMVAVDGGANAIIEEGFRPDMIVGDMDSATEKTLRCGAELVVHAYPDGRAPGRDRLEQLGLS